jgi:hypothetical protein
VTFAHESNHQIGRMYSKRVRLLVRIIGFLFCTIGLLYLSMVILGEIPEGFQTADVAALPGCRIFNTRDKKFFLCDADQQAEQQVRALVDSNDNFSGACYKTLEGYFTCYTRPSQKSYLQSEGVFVFEDPNKDFLPASIESDVQNVCGDYGITYNKLNTLYLSTIAIGGVIQSSINTVKGATTRLGSISTMYCNAAITDTRLIGICRTLSSGIGIFNGLPVGLAVMSTTVSTAVGNMNNISSTLYRTYDGFGYSTCSVTGFPGYVSPFKNANTLV